MTGGHLSDIRHVLVALGLLVSAVPTVVLAEDTADTAEDVRAIARKHYQRGKELYEAGKFELAQKEFQAAYDTKPHPVALKSIAECKAALGNVTGAIETLEKFLSGPAQTGRADAKKRIAELQRLLARLDVKSEPAGATVAVDGKDTGRVTPTTLSLNPGAHDVTLAVSGYKPMSKQTILDIGADASLRLDFTADGEPIGPEDQGDVDTIVVRPKTNTNATDRPASHGEIVEPANRLPVGFWITAAVTGVGLVSGTVFGVMALNAEEDYHNEPTEEKKDAGHRNAIISDVSLGVAAASGITSMIILLTHLSREKRVSNRANVAIVPIVDHNTAGVGAILAF
ncbi:MAG: PEGA domain-containing protein [Myxococcota bacterium]|nr:PEGA domain-containing protein [Myxococcota bacterium]